MPSRSTYQVSQKRPIDKSLKTVSKTFASAGKQSTVLTTVTFPCTITGLRWELTATPGPVSAYLNWAIVVVRDGNSVNDLATSDGSTFYEPEQDVLTFGTSLIFENDTNVGGVIRWEGSTKSMRKMMGGDQLVFVVQSTQVGILTAGVIQYFCKS